MPDIEERGNIQTASLLEPHLFTLLICSSKLRMSTPPPPPPLFPSATEVLVYRRYCQPSGKSWPFPLPSSFPPSLIHDGHERGRPEHINVRLEWHFGMVITEERADRLHLPPVSLGIQLTSENRYTAIPPSWLAIYIKRPATTDVSPSLHTTDLSSIRSRNLVWNSGKYGHYLCIDCLKGLSAVTNFS